jgi:hypothetical protein
MCKEGTVSADFAKRVPIWICTVVLIKIKMGRNCLLICKYADGSPPK